MFGTKRVSELLGMDVFNDHAKYLGKVHDAIIDLQKGEVVRLALQPIYSASKEDAARLFREHTILYKSVRAVEKIIMVSSTPMLDEEPASEEPPAKPMPYRYKYGYQPPK